MVIPAFGRSFSFRHRLAFRHRVAWAFYAALALVGCNSEPTTDRGTSDPVPVTGESASDRETPVEPPLKVAVTTPGLEFLTRSLARGLALDLLVVVPDGGHPAHGSPAAELILQVQESDLILSHGLGYEVWINTASLPLSKLEATADGLDTLELPGRTHSHGAEGEHSHRGRDPRVWLDPILFRDQARVVAAALKAHRPHWSNSVDERLDELEDRLADLADQLEDLLTGQQEIGLSPALAYWQQRFALAERSADSSGLWLTTFDEVHAQPAHTQPQDGRLLVALDPLDTSADGPLDYWARFDANLAQIRTAGAKLIGASETMPADEENVDG